MEHDQRVCPRCGEPAGDGRLCESCRSHLDSLGGIPAPPCPAAQAPREVPRLEPALAAASNGDSDRLTSEASAAALQVDPDPRPAENLTGDANAGTLEIAKLSTSADERVSDRAQPAREVARFEQVLTTASTDGTDRIAASTAADAMPEVRPARTEADETPAEVNAAPVREVELPTSDDGRDSDWARLRREVARLEQVLTIASTSGTDRIAAETAADAMPEVQPARTEADDTPGDDAAPVAEVEPVAEIEVPTSDEVHAGEPSYMAADALRQAFWFEQASALRSNGDGEGTIRQALQAAVPEVDPDPYTAVSTTSNVEPEPGEAQTSRRPWVAAVCLLALIALVAVLTGRDLRRLIVGQPS
jgi:hypothetical protein